MSHEPRPDRALVVSSVASPQVAEIARLVVRVVRCERPQADGCQEMSRDRLQDRAPPGAIQHRMGQRYGDDLIGATGIVIAVHAVDYVEQKATGRVPESRIE